MLRFIEGEQAIYAIPERASEQQFVGTRVTVIEVGPFHKGQRVAEGIVTGNFDYAIDLRFTDQWGRNYILGVKD